MHAMDVLDSKIQQLHQYDWSSGHARSQEGGLLIASMNFSYGGVGGKLLRDSVLTDGCVGDDDVFLYYVVTADKKAYWSREELVVDDDATVTKYDCRVRVDDTQDFFLVRKKATPTTIL